jgi:hypothetical protein
LETTLNSKQRCLIFIDTFRGALALRYPSPPSGWWKTFTSELSLIPGYFLHAPLGLYPCDEFSSLHEPNLDKPGLKPGRISLGGRDLLNMLRCRQGCLFEGFDKCVKASPFSGGRCIIGAACEIEASIVVVGSKTK